MKPTTVFFIQLPAAIQALAEHAAAAAFPHVEFIHAATVTEAGQITVAGRQLLVLGNVLEADISAAAQMTAGSDLPRWAVLILGPVSSDLVESVPFADCQAQFLKRVFRSTLLQHELLCENLKLQGDLKSVARRFSHDLRSPLNCAHITCELLKELCAGESSTLLPQIAVLQNSLSETFAIIDHFNFILKATTEPLPSSEFSMEVVLRRALEQLGEKIRVAGVQVKSPPAWPTVTGVAPWLEVIWRNLILNAIIHGASAQPIQLGWNQTGNAWRCWVENSGPPIPANIQTQLFRPFELLHVRSSAGLGLTIVERLVALQGGRCGYERTNCDTSVFYFVLPMPAKPKPSIIADSALTQAVVHHP